jgi:hypothetical protein
MTSSAIQIHLVGLLVPQLGQIFAKQAMGTSQLRQGARQVGRFDLAIVASSSGFEVLFGVDAPIGATLMLCPNLCRNR